MDLDKLLETGDRCIHDEPPVCVAQCPLHMDVKAFVAEIEKGDFKKAYKVMEKRIPFTRMIGMICDHPCEIHCVRKEAGGSINLGELERAVVTKGFTSRKKALSPPKSKGKVAIIGGGISGIVTAYDLDRKGYKVTIYEKSHRLGGRIWDYQSEELTKEIIDDELKVIEERGIHVVLNKNINKKELEEILQENDAVYLGTGQWKKLSINSNTFQVGDSKIFAGGRLINQKDSVIFSVSSGRRAAISIDRYVGKVSMTASREREGIFDSLLKYEIEDIEMINTIEKTGAIYTDEEAILEAKRCLKCQCIECIKACSHMKRFDISPNAYVRQINHNERIILGNHYANKMINACTLCGLCKEQCHLDISMKEIIQETRESMVSKGKMPVSAHDFALKDMKFSNGPRFSMVRKQPSKEESKNLFYYPLISYSKYVQALYRGTGKTAYLFYPGCQLPASLPEYIVDIYKHLVSSIKEDVGIYLGCCGAPAHWGGRQDLMEESIDKIKDTWIKMEEPTFILACSSCYEVFSKYMPEINCISLWEILKEYGLPNTNRIPYKKVLNVHDACSTRYEKKIHDSIRKIVTSLGYDIEELKYSKEKTKCCGYGGLVDYANRQQAEDFVEDRKKESEYDMLVYCAMCKDLFVRGGKRAYHILDLIFSKDLDNVALRKIPTLSERHCNRAQVKIKLLKEIWGEEMTSKENYDFNLLIPQNVMASMEKNFVLMEDVKRVVDNSRKTKERFFNPSNSNYLARLRIENVTYWIRYEESGRDVVINSVYSHRMEVVEE